MKLLDEFTLELTLALDRIRFAETSRSNSEGEKFCIEREKKIRSEN